MILRKIEQVIPIALQMRCKKLCKYFMMHYLVFTCMFPELYLDFYVHVV